MKGYTLVELMVVLVIIAIISLIGFINYKSFAADQVTVKAVGQVQSLLRLAQSNATASVLCNNQGAVSWFLIFTDGTTIELRCNPGNFLRGPYTLENAQISEIKGSGCLALSFPVTLSYSTGVGTLTISSSSSDACLQSATSIIFTVSNTKNPGSSPKPFSISKGGAIDVK